jgi:large subunit ribosomal protein L13
MDTWMAKTEAAPAERKWFVVDASTYNLGRLASQIAIVLRGKHKPTFTPHVDGGDFVVVINAKQVNLTGRKIDQKKYYAYSGYPGGLKERTARLVREDDPERMLRQAVQGMLPKNRLSKQIIKKLKVYGGSDHPHAAQSPQPLPQ